MKNSPRVEMAMFSALSRFEVIDLMRLFGSDHVAHESGLITIVGDVAQDDFDAGCELAGVKPYDVKLAAEARLLAVAGSQNARIEVTSVTAKLRDLIRAFVCSSKSKARPFLQCDGDGYALVEFWTNDSSLIEAAVSDFAKFTGLPVAK